MAEVRQSPGSRAKVWLRRAVPRVVVNAIRFGLSLVLLALYGAHLLGAIALDLFLPMILALLAILWFAPNMIDYIETIEIGGNKLTLRDLKKDEVKLEKSGLLSEEAVVELEPLYLQVASTDPNLALAGLRIEIEKELRLLAREYDVVRTYDRSPTGSLTTSLVRAEILSSEESNAIRDLLGTLNAAVHGAEVSHEAAEWAFEFGPRLLAALKKKHPDKPQLEQDL